MRRSSKFRSSVAILFILAVASFCPPALFAEDPQAGFIPPERCAAGFGFDPAGRECIACNGPCDTGMPGICRRGVAECGDMKASCRASIKPGDRIEACNREDDNCDGRVDEGFDKDGDGYTTCGGDCDDRGPTLHPDAVERCNGKDDNCNGLIDEGFNVGHECTRGLGICARGGRMRCRATGLTSECDATPGAPSKETCDGEDDDCDGQIDDGLGEISCGVGACQRSVAACEDGKAGTCVPGEPAAELCGDGIDDDCDGRPDDGFENLGQACHEGIGLCQRAGTLVCGDSKLDLVCSALPGVPGTEICGNNIDEDCNGQVDDLPGLGDPCDNALKGECLRAGKLVCDKLTGKSICSAQIINPKHEVCDGKDDDCDGVIDNGVTNACGGCGALPGGIGAECKARDGDECATGRWACVQGTAGRMECALDPALSDGGECASDDNACTKNICAQGRCTHPHERDGHPCDDGDSCTSADSCARGICRGGFAISCDDGNPCTEDFCVGHVGCGHAAIGSGSLNPCGGCTLMSARPGSECDVEGMSGVCRTGSINCLPDGSFACVGQRFASEEICDGLDDDCDGELDEDLGFTSCGIGACRVAVTNCVDGQKQVCTPKDPMPESCANMGTDDDCNGIEDDIAGLAQNCPVAVGTCIVPGRLKCVGDAMYPICVPIDPRAVEDDDSDGVANYCSRGSAATVAGARPQAAPSAHSGDGAYGLFDPSQTRAVILPWRQALASAVVAPNSPDQAILLVSGVSGDKGGIAALWAKDVTSSGALSFRACALPAAHAPEKLIVVGGAQDVIAHTSHGYVRYPKITSQMPSPRAGNFPCSLNGEPIAAAVARKYAHRGKPQEFVLDRIAAMELLGDAPLTFAGAATGRLASSSSVQGVGLDIVVQGTDGAMTHEFVPFVAGEGQVEEVHLVPLDLTGGGGIFVLASVGGRRIAGVCRQSDAQWGCWRQRVDGIRGPVAFAGSVGWGGGEEGIIVIAGDGGAREVVIDHEKREIALKALGGASSDDGNGAFYSALELAPEGDGPRTLIFGRAKAITAAAVRPEDGSLRPILGMRLGPESMLADISPGGRLAFGRPHAMAAIPLKGYGGRDLFAIFEIVDGTRHIGEMGFLYWNANEPPQGSLADIAFDGRHGSARLKFADPSGDPISYRASIRAGHGGALDDWIDGLEGGRLKFSVKGDASAVGLWPIEITAVASDPGGLSTTSRAVLRRDGGIESISEAAGAIARP